MASTTQNSEISLIEQLASPPKISLQILGTHTTSEQAEIVDFDLWLDYSNKAKIKSGEFLTSNESDLRSWNHSDESDESFPSISYSWLDDWLGDVNDRTSWKIRKRVYLSDHDSAAIKARAELLARSTAYGGYIKVEIHTPPLEVDLLPEEHTAVIRVEWSLDSSFIPKERSWDMMVMNAMVGRRRGFVSVDDPQPSYGMSPLRRGMKSNGTSRVVSDERDERGFSQMVLQYSKWGCDS